MRNFALYRILSSRVYLNLYYPLFRKMSTAGIIIIGDEILKGFTVDTNSHFLCKGLYNLGIKVGKISVVGDKIEDIADEVSSFSKKYTYVLTSGGIGPTHDDVTFAGVAAAFDDNLEQNHRIVDLLKNYYEKMQLDLAADQKYSDESKRKLRAASKLAMIPSTSTLYHPGDANNSTKQQFPLVRVRNVYIFPGIPSYLERSFTYFRYVFQRSATFYHEFLYVTRDEFGITDKLNVATDKFGNSVSFGSYPDVLNQYYKVKITVDSGSEQDTKDASNFLRSTIPDSCFINMESASVARSDRHVYGLLRCDVRDDQKSSFTMELGNALNVLEEAVDKFNQDEICLSFNGGKDCTVLLHLFSAVLRKKFGQDGVRDILTLYVSSSDTFPEVDDFIENTKIRYNLRIAHYTDSIKTSLERLKIEHPEVKAILMGTRASDPFSSDLESFAMTDSDWPQLMRISPLLHWTYHHIWMFLRTLHLPYCVLYDRGYTSLGHVGDTKPNPLLKVVDATGSVTYKPAYLLDDCTTERTGRRK